jgi:FtsZ-interacting cell division protein ZipA
MGEPESALQTKRRISLFFPQTIGADMIALNIFLAVVVLAGIVGLMLHAIHHEHKERAHVAVALNAKAAETRRVRDHRGAATGTPARRVSRTLSTSRG